MRRILVTGGAGFIGSHLVDRLVANSANRVVVLDNLQRGRVSNLTGCRPRIEFVLGDIRDRGVVETAIRNVDTVFHLAAQSNVLGAVVDLDYSFSTNVHGTLELLRAASASGVRRFLFASSREVYGDPSGLPVRETAPVHPKNAYGASKAASEAYCRAFQAHNFEVRVVRLSNVYGSRDFGRVIPIFINQALRGETLTIFGGEQILDFVWIDVVVEALIRAADLDSLPSPINVGAGKATNLYTLARRIVAETNSSSSLHVAPARGVEVAKFVADTHLQREHLGLESPEDPLTHLPLLVKSLLSANTTPVTEGQRQTRLACTAL